MKCNLIEMKKEIAALIPASHPQGGEATLLITVKGEKILDRRSTNWIMKRLAEYHNIDLLAIKKNYGPLLDKKRYIPLPLSQKLVYLPNAKTNTVPKNEKMLMFPWNRSESKRRPKHYLSAQRHWLICCVLCPQWNQVRDGRLIQK